MNELTFAVTVLQRQRSREQARTIEILRHRADRTAVATDERERPVTLAPSRREAAAPAAAGVPSTAHAR